MKIKFLFFCLLCFNITHASKTAGGANSDPLILYAIAILILGGLIGFPYFIKFIKKKWGAMKNENGEEDVNN